MGYSMSFDASVKCHKSDVRGLLHHIARDVDMKNGIIINHTNECIDSDYTQYNQTYYYDVGADDFKTCTDIRQIENTMAERLATVKRPLRRDAVVVRSLILQLDPEWYNEHPAESERQYSYKCMMEWACKTFGKNNIVAFTIHTDETNPHIHVCFVPVTEDGRLSQKDYFDKFKLKEQHMTLRQYMLDRGFEVDLKNRKPGKYAHRLSEDEYKDFAELQNEKAVLDSSFRFNVRRKQELDKRKANLDTKEQAIKVRESVLQKKIKSFLLAVEAYRQNLLKICDEYWCAPSNDDALEHYAKTVKNKNGVSFYDMYLKHRESERIRIQNRLANNRRIYKHFEDIARQAESSCDYSGNYSL